MKITVEIADVLLAEAGEVAPRRGVAFRDLVEAGLRHELAEARRAESFRLRDESFAAVA